MSIYAQAATEAKKKTKIKKSSCLFYLDKYVKFLNKLFISFNPQRLNL